MLDLGDNAVLILCIVLFMISWVLSVAFLYALYQETRGIFKENHSAIIFYLVAVEAIWAALMVVGDVWIVSSNGIPAANTSICVASATSVWLGVASLTAMHAVLAFDRLYYMHTLKPMTRLQLIGVFLSYFVVCMSIFVFAMTRLNPLDVWSTKTFCFVPVYSDDWDRKIPFLIAAGYVVIWISSVTGIYGYLAYCIYYRGQSIQHEIKNEKSERKQKSVLMRCILVLATLLITFGPNIFLLCINVFVDVPKGWYQFTLPLEILDGIFTPLLLLYLNKKNWLAFKRHVLRWNLLLPSTVTLDKSGTTLNLSSS